MNDEIRVTVIATGFDEDYTSGLDDKAKARVAGNGKEAAAGANNEAAQKKAPSTLDDDFDQILSIFNSK